MIKTVVTIYHKEGRFSEENLRMYWDHLDSQLLKHKCVKCPCKNIVFVQKYKIGVAESLTYKVRT